MLLAVCGCSAANVARKWCYCSLTGAGALLSQGNLILCRYRLKRGEDFGIVEKMGNNRAVSEVDPGYQGAETPLLPGEAALILANSTLG